MNETTLVLGIVLGAAAFLILRFVPARMRGRIGSTERGGSCGSKTGCGSKGCDGCH